MVNTRFLSLLRNSNWLLAACVGIGRLSSEAYLFVLSGPECRGIPPFKLSTPKGNPPPQRPQDAGLELRSVFMSGNLLSRPIYSAPCFPAGGRVFVSSLTHPYVSRFSLIKVF